MRLQPGDSGTPAMLSPNGYLPNLSRPSGALVRIETPPDRASLLEVDCA